MLEGVRVLDLGTTITAPLAGMMLADAGADVIKIERPDGDPFRAFRGDRYSPQFAAYNRNKRSVVLDLTISDDRARLHELIAVSDVLLENYRPSALSRLGLDPAMLRERYPRLIHCSITGFGAYGPYRDRPAFDAVAQALSGISSLFFDPSRPMVAGPTVADNVTGMYACCGILSALYERTRTGIGRRVEVNMLEASVAFIPDAFSVYTQTGTPAEPFTRSASSQSYAFQCADDKLISIHLSSIEKFWLRLVEALAIEDVAADERFANRADRVRNYLMLRGVLAERFAQRSRAEWLERLARADVPHAQVNTIPDVLVDPQVAALETFFHVEHATQGKLTCIHSPVVVDGERVTPRRPAPTLGEHTRDVLDTLTTPSVPRT